MNIFVLDEDISKCAEYHSDRHVVKMILESAQMLSTVCRESGIHSGYKSTHINHPCTKWCSESLSNWFWLRNLLYALNKEWRFRYNHSFTNHKSFDVAMKLPYPDIPDIGITKHALAMPDKYKTDSVVESYRNYYIGDKQHLFSWKNRSKPEWLNTHNTK